MKTLMAATAALALMAGTSALAQDDHHDRGDRGGPPPHAAPQGGRPAPPAPSAAAPQYQAPRQAPYQAQSLPNGPRYGGPRGGGGQDNRPQYAPGAPPAYRNDQAPRGDWRGRGGDQPGARPQDQGRPGGGGGFQGGRGPDRDGGRGDRRPDRGDFHQGRPGWGAPGFNPGGRDHPRYDPQFYPRQIRPEHRYHWDRDDWRPQRGFYYRRWSYGEYLPFGWFDQSYWVDNYWDYDLPVAPYGYQWVRVGPDVLLINLATGFVAETIYGLFY